MLTLSMPGAEDAGKAAAELLKNFPDKKIWLFYGEMGSGKTTLIKAICQKLGVKDPTSSPTFSIINEYRSPGGEPIYHFDFYRLKNEQEALDIGCEEYFYSGNLCLVEWPERIKNLLPEGALRVEIKVQGSKREGMFT